MMNSLQQKKKTPIIKRDTTKRRKTINNMLNQSNILAMASAIKSPINKNSLKSPVKRLS